MAPSRKKRRAILVGASMASLATLVACNNLIGLTDFTKGECPGARCEETDGGPDQFVPDGGPDVKDGSIDVKGADPVTWAAWKMPNYDGGPDVFLPNQPQLTSVDENQVLDRVTNLTWRKAVLATDSNTVAGAQKACDDLVPVGNWRLPKRIEVVTILDFGQPSGANKINTLVFTGVANARVWTGSDVQPVVTTGPRKYWTVSFETGAVEHGTEGNFYRVLCVRAK